MPEEATEAGAVIKVIGVGGAGGNAVNRMISENVQGVEFVVINTDFQDLQKSWGETKIQIGAQLTGGLGSGGDPEIGLKAVEESEDDVKLALEGANMVFVAAGMGGGTGTGAAPVVARLAREAGALTVAVVTKPFKFEGPGRARSADRGITELRKHVNTLIAIPNERLLSVVPEDTPFENALMEGDRILLNATRGIVELIKKTGQWNRDFADVRSVMSMGGDALMGIGEASGDDRARNAAEQAISSQLLEDTSIRGARAVLLHVAGNSSLSFHEAHACLGVVQEGAGGQADVYMGVGMDEGLGDTIRVTVIATGFGVEPDAAPAPEDDNELNRWRWRKREFDFDVDFSSGLAPSINQAPVGSQGHGTDSEVPAFLRRQAD
jgi:cell division protein FtsZ